MKIKFNERQRKACVLAVLHLQAAAVVLLRNNNVGKPLFLRGQELLRRIGQDGEDLAGADLNPIETDTLMRALNATHFIYILSKTLNVSDDERQKTLNTIRQCMSVFQ